MSDFDFVKAHRAASDELRRRELRRLFDVYAHPRNEFFGLLDALGSIQKELGSGKWMEYVNDVMRGQEMHDAALFPDEWLEELDGGRAMIDHAERLNAWHLDLAIVADAIDHVLTCIEEPNGLSATAYVLKNRLVELVENCPFPDQGATP